jgi:hypothetical protein
LEEKKLLPIVVFSLFYNALDAHAACSYNTTCPALLQEDFIKDSLKAVDTLKQDKDFQSFLSHSLEQRDTALESNVFQEVVGDFQKPAVQATQMSPTPDNLYIPPSDETA